ncbi:non-canonical purine NTP diphosphatase [Cytophagaceae bacterium ABcell3]|nr:non-canonical purine NTP diphosphatase [Cytophagaceae bacterium ABcell3]
MKLCFATNNPGKLKEIQNILGDRFTILSLKDIGCHEELPEEHETLEENSLQKADYVYNKYNVSCFADDTGLETECLNGAPGVYSARYAGPECRPEDNIDLLLKNMEACSNRNARFRTSITLILNGQVKQFEGIVEGRILEGRKGDKGFGYDPIFSPLNDERSFAELTMEEKNKISHRGIAVRKLTEYLQSIQ